jgi:Uncharacterized protein conserved in bacteria (DUF2188)
MADGDHSSFISRLRPVDRVPAIGSRRAAQKKPEILMKLTYHIVQHDGGWAYKLGEVFSETFPTHDAARAAAHRAAIEQQRPGETTGISWEDESGNWHEELAKGDDRPITDVEG